MEFVQQFRQTSFSGKELPNNQESNNKFKNRKLASTCKARLTTLKLRSAGWIFRSSWTNSVQTSKGAPTTIAHLFLLEANRTYPIEAIRQGFYESLAGEMRQSLAGIFSPIGTCLPEDFKFRKPAEKSETLNGNKNIRVENKVDRSEVLFVFFKPIWIAKREKRCRKNANKTENKTEKTEGGFDTYILMSFTFSCFLSI